jgi:hypothetical protein
LSEAAQPYPRQSQDPPGFPLSRASTFVQPLGRLALLHLGQHVVLSLPVSGFSGWRLGIQQDS